MIAALSYQCSAGKTTKNSPFHPVDQTRLPSLYLGALGEVTIAADLSAPDPLTGQFNRRHDRKRRVLAVLAIKRPIICVVVLIYGRAHGVIRYLGVATVALKPPARFDHLKRWNWPWRELVPLLAAPGADPGDVTLTIAMLIRPAPLSFDRRASEDDLAVLRFVTAADVEAAQRFGRCGFGVGRHRWLFPDRTRTGSVDNCFEQIVGNDRLDEVGKQNGGFC